MSDAIAPTDPFVSVAPNLGFVGGLDGVRAFAVVMVLMAHALGVKAGSFVGGVDVFMVVSGFLISTLLLQERRATGTIAIKSFYIRRALRLLPPLYVVLLFTIVISFFVDGGKYVASAMKECAAAFFYVYHVVFASDATAVAEHGRRFLPQLWSLSVEEHFYLLIGFTFVIIVRRNLVRQFAVAASLFILVGAISRLTNHYGPLGFWLMRPDSLLVGVVAAIANAHLPDPLSPVAVRRLKLAGTIGLGVAVASLLSSTTVFNKFGIAIIWTTYVKDAKFDIGTTWFGLGWTQIGFTAISLGFAPAVIAMVRLPVWSVAKALAVRPLRYVGRHSYTIYIWHIPMGILVLAVFEGHVPNGVLLLLLLGSIFGVSILSYRYVERPAIRLKMRWSPDPATVDLSKAG